ncbi:MAG: hypothetical protein ACJAZ1_000083 [Yoonia sp.]|jgi:hypothetical protein
MNVMRIGVSKASVQGADTHIAPSRRTQRSVAFSLFNAFDLLWAF